MCRWFESNRGSQEDRDFSILFFLQRLSIASSVWLCRGLGNMMTNWYLANSSVERIPPVGSSLPTPRGRLGASPWGYTHNEVTPCLNTRKNRLANAKRFSLCWHYLSSRQVTLQVLSARTSLTSVFGMGTGGPSSQSIPTYVVPCGDFMSKTFVCDFLNLHIP